MSSQPVDIGRRVYGTLRRVGQGEAVEFGRDRSLEGVLQAFGVTTAAGGVHHEPSFEDAEADLPTTLTLHRSLGDIASLAAKPDGRRAS